MFRVPSRRKANAVSCQRLQQDHLNNDEFILKQDMEVAAQVILIETAKWNKSQIKFKMHHFKVTQINTGLADLNLYYLKDEKSINLQA